MVKRMSKQSTAQNVPTDQTNTTQLSAIFDEYRERIENYLSHYLPKSQESPQTLHEAMRYSVLGGGKRIRPILVYATGITLGAKLEQLDCAAAAVELIHAYSLVHDDLPAMDNDDLRRGKPTCHKAFNDATAILAGDALQALAFQLLCEHQSVPFNPSNILKKINILATASGANGMVGGQAIDIDATGKSLTLDQLETMHSKKTGALIRASVLLGAYSATQIEAVQLDKLEHYSRCVGLAFQIRDDILDVESSTQILGKQQGADENNAKPTYTTLLSVEKAKKVADQLHQEAIESLANFDAKADILRGISNYIVQRQH